MSRDSFDMELLKTVQMLEKYDTEVIQYVSRQLRVWVQDEQQRNIRPYYHFAVRLYPNGQVIGYELCQVPDKKPTAKHVLEFLCRTLLHPPTEENSHRPGTISFTDQVLETQLANKLQKVGIRTQLLQPAEGLEDLVKAVSESLIKRELATRTDASERPGLLSKQGVELWMVEAFFTAAFQMRKRSPWSEFAENEVFGIRLNGIFRFVVILVPSVCEIMTMQVGSSENVFGVAVSSSLSHFRKKYRQAMGLTWQESSSSNICCTFCGAQQLLFTYRCTHCRTAYYCNEQCQKKDWPVHKEECQNITSKASKDDNKRSYLKRKEMTLIYCAATAVPFDDLDLQAQYGWPLYSCEDNFPVPFVMIEQEGVVLDRPTKEELQWLTRLCEVLADSCRNLTLSEESLVQDNQMIYIETLDSRPLMTATDLSPNEMEAKD